MPKGSYGRTSYDKKYEIQPSCFSRLLSLAGLVVLLFFISAKSADRVVKNFEKLEYNKVNVYGVQADHFDLGEVGLQVTRLESEEGVLFLVTDIDTRVGITIFGRIIFRGTVYSPRSYKDAWVADQGSGILSALNGLFDGVFDDVMAGMLSDPEFQGPDQVVIITDLDSD